MLAPLASLRLSLLWTLVVAISAAAVYLVATQVAFQLGWVLSFVYPFGALVLASVGSLAAHYLLAAFERERVRDVFSRFVPESVVEQVLARTDDDLRLGGVSLVGTIMFTDLRGFTTFSESLPADRVIQAVNYYLSEMTEAILEHEGTLVSYEGDGIMAVFGAPIEQPDHADRGVSTAREMLEVRLPRFNAWLREQDLSQGFKMGIGLNTGPFMSGNVGSERRLEYTVIGDSTNTASRLQGMTKGQAYLFYMADSTREALNEEVDDLVFVDEFDVRGRQEKVKIWSIEAASDAAFEAAEKVRREAVRLEARRLGEVAVPRPNLHGLVLAEVPDLDDSLHDLDERSVAAVLCQPLRPAHRRRPVLALGAEAALAAAPQPPHPLLRSSWPRCSTPSPALALQPRKLPPSIRSVMTAPFFLACWIVKRPW